MKKEVKRRAIECAAAAVLYIVAIVGSSYAELEREMRLLIFLLPYLIMAFATVRLLWNNLKKRKLFDENLLILLATAGAFAVHRYSEAVAVALSKIQNEEIDLVILQSRSPTCGVNQIYDGSFTGKLVSGMGLFAKALKQKGYHVIDVEEI